MLRGLRTGSGGRRDGGGKTLVISGGEDRCKPGDRARIMPASGADLIPSGPSPYILSALAAVAFLAVALPGSSMNRFPSGIRLLAAFLLVALSGCDRRPARPADERPADEPGTLIACFPDGGPVAFTVNGVPVPEKTIDRFAAFYRDMGMLNPDQAKARAIDEAILVTAAVYADFKNTPGKLEEWSSRVRAVDARLKAGEDFATVAKTASDDPSKERGGDLGDPFKREQYATTLTEGAFRQKVGETGPPVITVYGAHFLKVTKAIDGSSPEKDLRKASHILVAFDPAAVTNIGAYKTNCQKLRGEARVDSVKEPYKKLIPTALRR
jgi:hypothetical protein